MVLHFHHLLKCRHIHYKKGAIEVDLLKSSRKNFYHCYYLKLHQINMNRQDMYLICKNLRKWSYIFIITSNVGIFMTKKVLLKLIFWNQDGWIFIIATIWNCIKLMWIDRICIFVGKNLRKWSYIFILISNVGIFMTKRVKLKFIFWNQVEWIFIIPTIWNCIKLIWIDRIYIFVARI